ncbi:MAG: FIST C-terminal domain-containing protein [Defluviitaleaceae bacterium]|nr:FIST C-terminal domain-containing protein [Defluviitaleaceae bacterium]
MKSFTAFTAELDNAEKAASQLAESIGGKHVLLKNSIGILLCDADMDGAAVTEELHSLLGIEVAGMTTLGILDKDGFHEAAAVFTVLTADDCDFFTAASQSLAVNDYKEKIVETAKSVSPENPGAANGLVFAFCPNGMPFSGDVYPDMISEAGSGIPVIGGVASDDYDFTRARVFLSGKEYRDSLILAGVWGNIKPIFSIKHVTSRFAERIRRVSDAEGNHVRKVGDETFIQYLENFGLKTDVPDPVLAFTAYPMMLTHGDVSDEVPLMRHIAGLNHEDGSGTFFGDVPVGTIANICLINKNDIKAACRESMDAILKESAEYPGYEYSALFCMSCCGRAMILGSDSNAEGHVLTEMRPDGLTLAGAYCLGEICPTRYKDGIVVNRFHNCSITFCMI